jgi:hypothetical protein
MYVTQIVTDKRKLFPVFRHRSSGRALQKQLESVSRTECALELMLGRYL